MRDDVMCTATNAHELVRTQHTLKVVSAQARSANNCLRAQHRLERRRSWPRRIRSCTFPESPDSPGAFLMAWLTRVTQLRSRAVARSGAHSTVRRCDAALSVVAVDPPPPLSLGMNVVREIERINARELELNVSDSASWHAQYAHSAYIFVAALDTELTEGDVIAAFSQYGEVVDCNLVRDKQSGKSRGFAFVAYEDQRSCVLAIDNMNGAKLLGRTLRVDHADRYRRPREAERKGAGGGQEDEYKQFEEGGEGYDERRKRIWDYERWAPLAATQQKQAVLGAARQADTAMGAASAITSYTAERADGEDKQAAKIMAMWEERKRRKQRQEEEERRREREESRRGGRGGERTSFGDQLLDDGEHKQQRGGYKERGSHEDSDRRERGGEGGQNKRRSRSRSRSRSPARDYYRRSRHRTDRDRR